MKFSPVPKAGIAVAAVAAISVTAVALKKKGNTEKKPREPLASFTAKEWEDLRDWPAVKEVLHKVEHLTSKSDKDDVQPVTKDPSTPKSKKESVKRTDLPVSQAVIGDEPWQIKPFSEDYKRIIKRAFKEASNDDTVTLELYGKTFGLGARGQKIEDGPLPGTLYNASDIAKLYKKLELG